MTQRQLASCITKSYSNIRDDNKRWNPGFLSVHDLQQLLKLGSLSPQQSLLIL